MAGLGKLDILFARLDAMMHSPFSRPVETKIKVTCPCGCGHTFAVTVKQNVAGAVLDFNSSPIISPWKEE